MSWKVYTSAGALKTSTAAGGGTQKFTTSALSGGPPASPADGDIWIATGVDANGTRWQFQYNAGSASAYKWEFIGGPQLLITVVAEESTSSTSLVDLTTVGPTFTPTRSGEYHVDIGCMAYNATADNASRISWNSVTLQTGAATRVGLEMKQAGVALTASTAYKMQYQSPNATSATFGQRYLAVTPRRIS